MPTRLVPVLALLVLTFAGHAEARRGKGDRLQALEQRIAELEKSLALRPMDVSAYRLPDEVEFCGEKIDLGGRPDVRERLEKEFLLVLGDRAQVVLWAKRAGRVFPTVEKVAREMGTCEDLKYLAVVESGLRPAVTSHASAKGWWQFMSGTARDMGLDVGRAWDERADLGHATRAGLTYLKSLRESFGSWSLAMAAYNTGPGRLRRAQREQGLDDFWRLDLYTEAERYVPRVMAVKTVMANLERYGFHVGPEDQWRPHDIGYVKVKVPGGVSLEVLAAAKGSGIDYRTFRLMNPELGRDTLPTDQEVVLEVPRGKEKALRSWLTGEIRTAQRLARKARKARRARARKRKRRTRRYTVRPGDSLWGIAQKRGVSVADLRKWNRMGKGSVLQPGQRLIVKR